MTEVTEILSIASAAEEATSEIQASKVFKEMQSLSEACNALARAWSGSSMGYHAETYTEDLKPPGTAGAFSVEWGLTKRVVNPTRGYRQFDPDEIKAAILTQAGSPNLDLARDYLNKMAGVFHEMRAALTSILTLEVAKDPDVFIEAKLKELRALEIKLEGEWLEQLVPGGEVLSRDVLAMGQGRRAAPHHKLYALPVAYGDCTAHLTSIATLARAVGSHLARKAKLVRQKALVGTNVFIGHGRAIAWRDLKDFVSERLKLPYDEFNRVPVAGVTNIVRLSEMLDAAAIAFIVMTAEDEMADGNKRARVNVVHEAGLFQGRLGFTRAIILLEEGCEDFSNVEGLGQIRFPKGDIRHAFEEIRRVLEREGIISAS